MNYAGETLVRVYENATTAIGVKALEIISAIGAAVNADTKDEAAEALSTAYQRLTEYRIDLRAVHDEVDRQLIHLREQGKNND